MPNGVRYTNAVRALHRRFCRHCGGPIFCATPRAEGARGQQEGVPLQHRRSHEVQPLVAGAERRAEGGDRAAAVGGGALSTALSSWWPRATVPEETAADIRRRHGLGVLPSRISRDLGLTSYQIKNVLRASAAGPSAEEPTKQ